MAALPSGYSLIADFCNYHGLPPLEAAVGRSLTLVVWLLCVLNTVNHSRNLYYHSHFIEGEGSELIQARAGLQAYRAGFSWFLSLQGSKLRSMKG
jgi:hypothetical protein